MTLSESGRLQVIDCGFHGDFLVCRGRPGRVADLGSSLSVGKTV